MCVRKTEANIKRAYLRSLWSNIVTKKKKMELHWCDTENSYVYGPIMKHDSFSDLQKKKTKRKIWPFNKYAWKKKEISQI